MNIWDSLCVTFFGLLFGSLAGDVFYRCQGRWHLLDGNNLGVLTWNGFYLLAKSKHTEQAYHIIHYVVMYILHYLYRISAYDLMAARDSCRLHPTEHPSSHDPIGRITVSQVCFGKTTDRIFMFYLFSCEGWTFFSLVTTHCLGSG